MERKPGTKNIPQPPMERPRGNGTGPATIIRKEEVGKKHIKRDGKR
jgi:hypothetical protein